LVVLGVDCTVDPCASQPCQNNATCFIQEEEDQAKSDVTSYLERMNTWNQTETRDTLSSTE